MNRNRIIVMSAVVALLFASLACNAVSGGGGSGDNNSNTSNTDTNNSNTSNSNDGFSFSTANITNAHLALDEKDTQKTTSYTPDVQTFYCYFDLNNAPDDTVVKGTWTLVSADGYDSNSEIDSADITGSDNTYYFQLSRSTDAWPVGKYKIDLYLNGDLAQTIEFDVK
jgi:hypothetical protein